MKTLNIDIRKVVTLNLSPRDWALYDMKGVYVATSRLNDQLAQALNAANDEQEAFEAGKAVLERFSAYGATDTEPRTVLIEIIERMFSKE